MLSWIVRIVLVLVGILVVLIGWVLWDAEGTYGLDLPNYAMEIRGNGRVTVIAIDEVAQEETEVFTGTQAEVNAYIDQQVAQAGGKNYLGPGLTIAAGVLLVIAAIAWPRRAKRKPPDVPVSD